MFYLTSLWEDALGNFFGRSWLGAFGLIVALTWSGADPTLAQPPASKYELKSFAPIELGQSKGLDPAVADLSPNGESIAAAFQETARVYEARSHKPITADLSHGQKITHIQFDR